MNITRGRIKTAVKLVIYGPEGIGKSTFASKFPDPVFIDTEGSTVNLDVARFPRPKSWQELVAMLGHVKANPDTCRTLVVDTADWAETLCIKNICAAKKIGGIEDLGYGKGYTFLEEEFEKALSIMQDIVSAGINVVVTAHAQIRKFELPDELGAFDRWELKLEKKTSALLKEWADVVLFANYKTFVVNVDNQGAAKGKNRAQGGSRVMYTSHHSCWDAKNRHGLDAELPLEYESIRHLFESVKAPEKTIPDVIQPEPIVEPIPPELAELMKINDVRESEIQAIVAKKGYYTIDTPISQYSSQFIHGVLIGAWEQVYKAITENALPFEA